MTTQSCASLAHHEHLVVVGEAEDGEEALAKAKELSPDLVLMDLDMPKLNGLAASEILHREHPHIKIVILSVHNPARYAVQLLKSGAHGCLSKDASTAELVEAIETVAGGGDYFSADVAQSVLRKLSGHAENKDHQRISIREREVLLAIAEGLSNKEIAGRLEVGLRTVETHRERIMRKLNLHGAADLTRFAIAEGLIAVPNGPQAR
jgi:two-component system, NarL family, nitrate/nitrite response regulator NarL